MGLAERTTFPKRFAQPGARPTATNEWERAFGTRFKAVRGANRALSASPRGGESQSCA